MKSKPGSSRRSPKWRKVPSKDWSSWEWQVRNRVTTVGELEGIIDLTQDERNGISGVLKKYRMAITPYYASLMDPEDYMCPIRLQAVPREFETLEGKGDLHDPLAEERDSVAHNLVHRYPDRVLLLATDQCSMYCRHCTRRRIVGMNDRPCSRDELEAAFNYIKKTPVVRDVVVSGGDALVMSDDRLEFILKRLRDIEHVEIIRLGSRVPVVCPMRVTPNLVKIIKKYNPVYVNTQFNHPKEFTPESSRACEMLVDGGIPVGNQTVLLRRINSSPMIMKYLVHELMKIRVRPYYIFQCDLSEGIEHFRTPINKGIEIMEYLRGHTSGLAVPTYVVDLPDGGGKVPLLPQYLVTQSEDVAVFRNYKGRFSAYAEPSDRDCSCPGEGKYASISSEKGLADLLDGKNVSIVSDV